MNSLISISISSLFFIQSAFAAPNAAYQNIKPVLNIEHGQAQKTKFKDLVQSLPDYVRSFPEMENLIKFRGEELVTISRADYANKNRKYSRILLTVGGQSVTLEIPENAEALKGDAVLQIGKAKFRVGDFGDLEHTMKVWYQQDPEFLERAAVNEAFRFLDPLVWKSLKPEARVTVMLHMRMMAPEIEQLVNSTRAKKGNKKKSARSIYDFLLNEAHATGTGACAAGGYQGTYHTSGFCQIAAASVGFNCGAGQSPCNPLFYRKTDGTRGLCVNVPTPSTDVVSYLCESSSDGIRVSNFQEAENFVRAYLRNENQTATGFAGNLGQLQGAEREKIEAYKNMLETALTACRSPGDDRSSQNCTSLQARIRLLQQAISGDSRGALQRAADWTDRTATRVGDGIGGWVNRNPWWTALIAGVAGIGVGVLAYSMIKRNSDKKKKQQEAVKATATQTQTCTAVATCCSVNGSYSIYPDGCCGGGGGIAVGYDTANCGSTTSTGTTTTTITRTTVADAGSTTSTGEIVTSRKLKDTPASQPVQQKGGRQ